MKRILLVFSLVVFSLPAEAKETPDSHEIAQKMLDKMGGPDVWKNAKLVHNTAINHHPQSRLPYIQQYWYDTHKPRHYVTIKNHDLDRARAYDSVGGCGSVEGEVARFSIERHRNELTSWSRSMYRKLFLLASDPDNLDLNVGINSRIEFTYENEFLGWIIVQPDGSPSRHGGTNSMDIYTEFEELVPFGKISWPRGGKDESGWSFEMLSIDISETDMPGSREQLCGTLSE